MTVDGSLLPARADLGRMRTQRHDKLQAQLEAQELDGLVLLGTSAVAYATGAAAPSRDSGRAALIRDVAVVAREHDLPYLCTSRPEGAPVELVGEHLRGPCYPDLDEGASSLGGWLRDLFAPGARLGVDELPHALQRAMGGYEIVAASTALGAVKLCKTVDELACIRAAQRVNEEVMLAVQPLLGDPGVRLTDLSAAFLRAIFELGAEANGIDPIWQVMPLDKASGPWTVHGDVAFPTSTTPRALAAGDVVWVDTGIHVGGYASDFGRTWIAGDVAPTARQLAQRQRWQEVVAAVLEICKPGATGLDLCRAAIAANGGTRPWIEHFYLAHGVGTDSAEMPLIGTDLGESFDEGLVLAPGMVLVLEPVIWDDGAAGYRSEDIYAITDDGWTQLSDHPLDFSRSEAELPRRTGSSSTGTAKPDRLRAESGSSRSEAELPRRTGSSYAGTAEPDRLVEPPEELRLERRERLFRAMGDHDLDVLVLARAGDVAFATGARQLWTAGTRPFGPACVAVRETGHVHLLSVSDEGVPPELSHDDLFGLSWNPANLGASLAAIPGLPAALRIGTASSSPGFPRLLAAVAPAAEVVDGAAAVRAARALKSKTELACIRQAIALARSALVTMTDALVPGVSERHLLGVYLEHIAALGAPTAPTEGVVCATAPHGPVALRRLAGDDPIRSGQLVVLDPGAMAASYEGGLGRTVVVGDAEPQRAQQELARRCSDVHQAVIARCRTGAVGADLLAAWDESGEILPAEPVAHGIGLGAEPPVIGAGIGARETLAAGVVLAVSSWVSRDGVGGWFERDIVLVTDDEPEVLTQ